MNLGIDTASKRRKKIFIFIYIFYQPGDGVTQWLTQWWSSKLKKKHKKR